MSRQAAPARSGSDRASLYSEITNKIIAELEGGRVPWVQPWGTAPPPRQIVYAAGGCLLISLLAPFVIFPGFRWLWECVCGIFPNLGPSW